MRSMRWSWALFLMLAATSRAGADELPSARYKLGAVPASAVVALAPIDVAKARAEDTAAQNKAQARRYGLGQTVKLAAGNAKGAGAGAWQTLPDGQALWRLELSAPNAVGIDLGFSTLFLPQGARLYFTSADGAVVRGPYTDADVTAHGEFWLPIVPGDRARLELIVPAERQADVRAVLGVVHRAYRLPAALDKSGGLLDKSLSCHIDVACSAADPYRNQVHGVAGYTLNGPTNDALDCTGTLLANTRRDSRRFFLTARHCLSTQTVANSVVVYWNYESATCRTPGSSASGTPISIASATPHTGGTTLRATIAGTDSTLLELNQAIPAGVNPYFVGWDRRDGAVASRTAVIHHSNGNEKRISFDDDAPILNTAPTGFDSINYQANGSWRVVYDRATTEGGASGSALLTPEGRVIGQLGFGEIGSCSRGIEDNYGRFASAWEGAGTTATSLRPWLDPDSTGAQTLDGSGACAAPTATLTVPATGSAGDSLNFALTLSGGSAPYTVQWDVDGDGTVDRRQTNITNATQLAASYPTATSTTVIARVTDNAGCETQAQRALNVSAPDIVFSAQSPQQVCGDGDAAIEPGEQWRVPFSVNNVGGKALNGAYAVFAGDSSAGGGAGGAVDSFGYRMIDSTSAGCGFQAVPVSAGVSAQTLTPSSGFGADDDGRTTALNLGPAGIDFYGQRVNQLVMSTNGYLATDLSDDGGDFQNGCPDDSASGGRLHALHDDLVVRSGGGLYREYFATCPRAADVGGARGCTVFSWRGMARVVEGSGGAQIEGNFDLQAIVYDGTYEIVFQYINPDPQTGGSATIGIQNPGPTIRSQYSCDTAQRATANRAVCFFHPSAQPSTAAAVTPIFDQPAVAVPNLASGQSANGTATFYVPATAACGAPIGGRYVGTVDSFAYSLRGAALFPTTTLGAGGACQVSSCPALPTTAPSTRDGLYSSLVRFGNGLTAYNIPVGNARVFAGQWYTGTRARTPEWLIVQGDLQGAQADVPIYRFRQTSTTPFAATSEVVGRAQISYFSPTDMIVTWVLDNVPGGERLTFLYGTNRPGPNRTGSWEYRPNGGVESGWGQSTDDHILPNGAIEKVIINYLYDSTGKPVWTLGGSPNLNGGTMEQATYAVHCPNCATLPDFLVTRQIAGSVTYSYSSLTDGAYSTQIVLPGPLTGTWNRAAQPMRMITPVAPQP